jgi:hypothetical protein
VVNVLLRHMSNDQRAVAGQKIKRCNIAEDYVRRAASFTCMCDSRLRHKAPEPKDSNPSYATETERENAIVASATGFSLEEVLQLR